MILAGHLHLYVTVSHYLPIKDCFVCVFVAGQSLLLTASSA